MLNLARTDPEVARAIRDETRRQGSQLELIASENFVSEAVLEALGTVLTNKYAEGYPGKRYYGGCEFVDVAESLARDRVKELFGCEHANVQPHSGAQANMAVYMAMLKPGDTILGMNLSHGGHLSHGHPLNFSGHVLQGRRVRREKGRRADRLRGHGGSRRRAPAEDDRRRRERVPAHHRLRGGPQGGRRVGAVVMADIAHVAGLVAAGLHPSPVPHAEFVTSTTHKTLRGPRGGLVMCQARFAKELDRSVFPGVQGGPADARDRRQGRVPSRRRWRPTSRPTRRRIVENAKALAETLVDEGWRLVSGGTDNHLMLVDVFSRGITGKAAEAALDRAGITVNKNTIPFDTELADGRLGDPPRHAGPHDAAGWASAEMEKVGRLIARALRGVSDEQALADVRTMSRSSARSSRSTPRGSRTTSAPWPGPDSGEREAPWRLEATGTNAGSPSSSLGGPSRASCRATRNGPGSAASRKRSAVS